MLNEYVNDHAVGLDRELRAISQSRPRYGRPGHRARPRVRALLRSLALPAVQVTPGSSGVVPEVVIRPAVPADGGAVSRLAEVSERRLPSGLVLVAEVEEQLVAALPVSHGFALADIRRPTADVVQLLELRRDQLSAAKVA
jgi:hypothetical protein